MRSILILGAGRSASALIRYLIEHAAAQDWRVMVADRDGTHAAALITGSGEAASSIALDATDATARAGEIAKHDLVISMLPAFMHMDVVKDCIRLKKHVLTPSYVPDAMWPLDGDAKAAGLILLNELGLDPGIDHMSAMRIIDRIKSTGGIVTAFESYCGGLVAPESDNNPWGYKFSWNPRNVILAGQGGAAKYIQDGVDRYIPYHQLFKRTTRIDVAGYGSFDGYANRDSLKYRSHYGLDGIPTLMRGTLRKQGYCAAWDVFVQLGCTEDGYELELDASATWSDFLRAFLPTSNKGVRETLVDYLKLDPNGGVMAKLDWLGLFGDAPMGIANVSPAAALQHLLEQKWKLGPADKDMVVMWHRFVYSAAGKHHELHASLVVTGQDQTYTAMAKTVGLPVAIAAKMVLNGKITRRGVLMPLAPEIYDPVLDELEHLGIVFSETEA